MTSNLRLFLILIALNVCWGPVNFMVKVAGRDLSEAAILMARWVSFATSLWLALRFRPFQRASRLSMPEGLDALRAFAIGALFMGPAHALYYVAIRGTSSIESTVLTTSSPVWTAMLAVFVLNERVTVQRWAAILMGCVGAYIVSVGFGPPTLQGAHTVANLVYMGGVIAESFGMVLAAKIILRSSGTGTLAWQVAGMAAAAIVLPFVLPSQLPLAASVPSLATVGAISYLVFVAGFLCFGVWYMYVEKAPVSLMVVSLAMQAPVAAIVGWSFLGERITPETWWGFAAIAAALGIGALEKPQAAVTSFPDRGEVPI